MDKSTKSLIEKEISWVDDFDNRSTETPSFPQDANALVTIIVIALAVILTIVLLFGMAVFIDCRHQKMKDNPPRGPKRKLFNFPVPQFLKFRRFSNDEDSFADKIYEGEINS